MTSPFPLIRRRALPALLVSFLLASTWLTASAQTATRTFDIPAGKAEVTLKQFAAQSGAQFFYSAEKVAGVQTNALKGKLTPGDALDSMLARTELVAVRDEKTGAYTIRRSASVADAEKNVSSRLASSGAADQGKVESGKVVLDTYEVTGSRMRLNSGERPAQPVLTFTAKDIERTGASSLAQLFQYIPAVTSSTTGGLGVESANGQSGGTASPTGVRTNAQLRGGTESATLLLVDGMRVPRTGQRNSGGVGFDLGGIPLSAIDRVEVLLDGASAIYGNDALYGVINVILKKNYAGSELRLNYDNTFDKDAAVRTASFTHGFAKGKWSGLFTLSASNNNVQLMQDRAFTASYDRRPWGGTTAGSVLNFSFNTLSVASGNLPGLTTQYASIPSGATGQNLTIADFANAPAPVFGRLVGPTALTQLITSQSGYARLNYAFSDRLELSAMARLGRNDTRDNGEYRRAQGTILPAGYPGNPFGVPVRLYQYYSDLPRVYTSYEASNDEFGLSAKGKLWRDWSYEASVNYVRGTNDTVPPLLNGQFAGPNLNQTALNAAIVAGRQPLLVYDPLTQSPNLPGANDDLWVTTPGDIFAVNEISETWTYAAQADGSLFSLPAGEVRAVMGTEYREEYIDIPYYSLSALIPWNPFPARKVTAAFAEVRVPIVAPKQNWLLVNQLDLNLAARTEGYSDIKGGQTLTPRYGVSWRPVASLLVRGSYGEGFLVPNLYQTLPVQTVVNTFWANSQTPIDSLRGNTNLVGQPYTLFGGGNPDLRPQTSQNWGYGVVWDVPKLKGLSVSVDFYDFRFIDRFGTVSLLADRIAYAPETLIRGPNLPGDPAGWAGPITGVINRTINVAAARVSGYNFGVRWNRSTPWGDLSFFSSGEKILLNEQRLFQGSAPLASVNKKFNPIRVTTSLYWSRGAWDAGITNSYRGRYWRDTNNAALAPSRWTDDVMRWDLNASYDYGKNRGFGERGASWWRRALHDTKWSATIINLGNTLPTTDVVGFYRSDIIDLRLRRYIIDITKRF